MNPKYQKVCAEIAKTEKKVEDLQGQLKELYDKKTELENAFAAALYAGLYAQAQSLYGGPG